MKETSIEKIEMILSKYFGRGDNTLHSTVDELCRNGIGRGCYQNYAVLADVVQILHLCIDYVEGEEDGE